jgi:hypothetical protein
MSYENTHYDAYVELQDAEKLTDRVKVVANLIDIADQEFSFAAPLSFGCADPDHFPTFLCAKVQKFTLARSDGILMTNRGTIFKMELTPEQTKLWRIFHPFAARLQSQVESKNIRFVHYTRADVAMEIIRNREIWLRKSRLHERLPGGPTRPRLLDKILPER